MFAKLFTQIFDSSIADNWMHRHVFEDLLKLADRNGIVDMTPEAIIARTRLPEDMVREALVALAQPDPRSRTRAEDGRRIILLDPARDWGWRIVNYEHYRSIKTESDRCMHLGQDQHLGYVYYAMDSGLVKIGFSKNPWARIKDYLLTRKGIRLVATERTTVTTGQLRLKEFSESHVGDGWFRHEGNLAKHLVNLGFTKSSSSPNEATTVGTTVATTTASASGTAPTPEAAPSKAEIIARLKVELERMFKRKTVGVVWDYDDESLLLQISGRPDAMEEFREIEQFRPNAERFPESIHGLLLGWVKTLDRARNAPTPAQQTKKRRNVPNL